MDKLLFLLVGILVGFILSRSLKKKELPSSGYLRIDHSDPDSPYWFVEIKDKQELSKIEGRKKVCFDVKLEDFVPQK